MGQLGQSEVQDLQSAVLRHHHVGRLEIAVSDAGGMRLRDGVGQLDSEVHQAVERKPSDYHARFNFAQALRRTNQPDEAAVHEKAAGELRDLWSRFSDLHIEAIDQPTNTDIRSELGEIAEKLGRPELAGMWFRAALGIDPSLERALKGLQRVQDDEVRR